MVGSGPEGVGKDRYGAEYTVRTWGAPCCAPTQEEQTTRCGSGDTVETTGRVWPLKGLGLGVGGGLQVQWAKSRGELAAGWR